MMRSETRLEFMVAEVHLTAIAVLGRKLAKFSKDTERLERSLEHTKYPDDVRKKLDTAQKNVGVRTSPYRERA